MSHWHPGVLPVLLFFLGAFSMAIYTLMRHDAPRTTLFAGVATVVLTVLTIKVFTLWPGIALFGGFLVGYFSIRLGISFFPPQEVVIADPPYDPLFGMNERQVDRWRQQRDR